MRKNKLPFRDKVMEWLFEEIEGTDIRLLGILQGRWKNLKNGKKWRVRRVLENKVIMEARSKMDSEKPSPGSVGSADLKVFRSTLVRAVSVTYKSGPDFLGFHWWDMDRMSQSLTQHTQKAFPNHALWAWHYVNPDGLNICASRAWHDGRLPYDSNMPPDHNIHSLQTSFYC